MSRINFFFLLLVMLGFGFFLYGSAFYNSIIGWIGVYFLLGGILAYLILYIYDGLLSKKSGL